VIIVAGLAALASPAGAAGRSPRAVAGRHYLALVKPVDAANATLRASGGWVSFICTGSAVAATDAATSNTAVCSSSEEQPVIAAMEQWQGGLERFGWPKSNRNDVGALLRAVALEIGQLNLIGQPDATAWQATLQRDEHGVTAAANLVRHDLGLATTASQ